MRNPACPPTLRRLQRFRDVHQNAPQPHASRVSMGPSWMKDIFVKGANVQRDLDSIEIEAAGIRVGEALRYYSDKIGLRDDVQSLQIVWNSQRHVTLQSLLPEPGIHQIFTEVTRYNGNMPCLEKLVRVSYPFSDRVATPYRARVTVRKETLLIESFEFARHTSNGDVNKPRELVWVLQMAVPRLNTDANVWSLFPQSLQQRGKQQGARMICYRQPKHASAARRLESVPHQERSHALKCILYRIAQSFSTSSKLHARANAY